MDLARTVYSFDLKIAAMRALDAGSATGEIARKYQLESETSGNVGAESGVLGTGFPGIGRRGSDRGPRRRPPYSRAGAQDWPADDGERAFKKALQHLRGSSPASRRQWRGCLFEEVQQGATKGQAVNALCEMTGLSRAGFCRWRIPAGDASRDGNTRSDAEGGIGIAGLWLPENHAEMPERRFAINHNRV